MSVYVFCDDKDALTGITKLCIIFLIILNTNNSKREECENSLTLFQKSTYCSLTLCLHCKHKHVVSKTLTTCFFGNVKNKKDKN